MGKRKMSIKWNEKINTKKPANSPLSSKPNELFKQVQKLTSNYPQEQNPAKKMSETAAHNMCKRFGKILLI